MKACKTADEIRPQVITVSGNGKGAFAVPAKSRMQWRILRRRVYGQIGKTGMLSCQNSLKRFDENARWMLKQRW